MKKNLCFKFKPIINAQERPEKTLLQVHPNGLVQTELLTPEERHALSTLDFGKIPLNTVFQLLAINISLVGELRVRISRLEIEVEELRRQK